MANPTLDEAAVAIMKAAKLLVNAMTTQQLLDLQDFVTATVRRETSEPA